MIITDEMVVAAHKVARIDPQTLLRALEAALSAASSQITDCCAEGRAGDIMMKIANGTIDIKCKRADSFHFHGVDFNKLAAALATPARTEAPIRRWQNARLAVVNLSISAPDYRDKLNELSEAEDGLAVAMRKFNGERP